MTLLKLLVFLSDVAESKVHDCLRLGSYSLQASSITAKSYISATNLFLDKPPDDIDPIDRRELVVSPSVLTFDFENLLVTYDKIEFLWLCIENLSVPYSETISTSSVSGMVSKLNLPLC